MALSYPQSELLALITEIEGIVEADTHHNTKAHADLVTKINKLRNAVETPLETFLRIYLQPMQNAALRVAVEHELFDHLLDNGKPGTEPITARRLMDRHGDPTLSEAMITRIMRAIVAMGLCNQDANGYLANAKTIALALPGLTSGIKFGFDTHLPILANLVSYLQTIGFNSPDDSCTVYGSKENNAFRSPFEHTFGQPMFEWLKANPTYLDHFNAYMAARRVGFTSWADLLPPDHTLISGASTDPSAVFIVDVGGGRGHDLTQLLTTHPHIPGRAILQDLPQTIAENRKRGTTTPFEMMPHDFFAPQPIKGARLYHLHAILHDFADASCLRILAHLAAAMTPGYSHLVVSEIVLPETGCALFPALMDMQMMVLCAGMERTETQWRALLGKAGLGGVRVYEGGEGAQGVVVAVRDG